MLQKSKQLDVLNAQIPLELAHQYMMLKDTKKAFDLY
jgi:hypothetical protein